MITSLLRIYHSTLCTRVHFRGFLEGIAKLLEHEHFVFGLSYRKGEFAYSLSGNETVMQTFASKLYTEFGDFQINLEIDAPVGQNGRREPQPDTEGFFFQGDRRAPVGGR